MSSGTPGQSRRRRRSPHGLAPWLFQAPRLLLFAIDVVARVGQSTWISFHEWDGLGAKTGIGLANYAELMQDDSFYTSVRNNVLWLVL